MSRRQTFIAKPGELKKSWHVVDAEGVPLGRLAAEVAQVLMGKHRPEYTPHVDCGDYVIVTNAGKVGLTGRKAEHRLKMRYSSHPGGGAAHAAEEPPLPRDAQEPQDRPRRRARVRRQQAR
jgi:large subunit ribosomal protein L13